MEEVERRAMNGEWWSDERMGLTAENDRGNSSWEGHLQTVLP